MDGPVRLPDRPLHVLVTGAAGFIGSHVAEGLLAAGHRVTGVDGFTDSYDPALKQRNLTGLLAQPGFTFAQADLATDPIAPLLDGVDVIVNEAAMPGLVRSWSDIEAYSRDNIVAVQRLLEAATQRGIELFVQASTSSVYGRVATGDETAPTRPVSPYGATKLAAEHLVEAYADSFGLNAIVLRYFSIFGPRQRPDMAYTIFIHRLAAGLPITVFGDGEQTRSNTFVEDCVRGTLLAIARGRPGEVYNIGGGEVISLNQVIEVLGELLESPVHVRYAAPRPGDQRHTQAAIGKAARELGYAPRTDPVTGLAAQVAWARDLHRELTPAVGS